MIRVPKLIQLIAVFSILTTNAILWAQHGPGRNPVKKEVTISPETTFLTAPLRPDGSVDLAAGINKRMKEGVTPQNNACVLLIEAIRPLQDWDTPPTYFDELERRPPPRDRGHVNHLLSGITDPSSEADQQRFDLIYEFLGGKPRPWTRSEFPEIAKVIDGDEAPLRIVHAAAQRDRFYSPIITRGVADVDPLPMLATLDPMTSEMPYLVHSLRFRAMLNLGEGNLEAAWKDLFASLRLGRLVGMGPSKEHAHRNYILEELNCAAMEAYLRKTHPSALQAKRYLKALRSLPSRARLSKKFDLTERCTYLDSLLVIRANREDAIALLDVEQGLAAAGKMVNLFWSDSITWDDTLRSGNTYYNRLVENLEIPSFSRRRDAVDSLRQELKAVADKTMGIQVKENAERPIELDDAELDSKSRLLAAMVAGTMLSDINRYIHLEDRVRQRFAHIEIALALAAFHADHSAYPSSLNELTPKYLTKVPEDTYSGQAPIYRRRDRGYLLYSVGENLKDDGGRDSDDTPAGDDLSVRMTQMRR